MNRMFYAASAFNQDIGELEHRKSDYYVYMFHSASAFNQDIGSWNTAQVTDMHLCFVSLLRSTKILGVGTQGK